MDAVWQIAISSTLKGKEATRRRSAHPGSSQLAQRAAISSHIQHIVGDRSSAIVLFVGRWRRESGGQNVTGGSYHGMGEKIRCFWGAESPSTHESTAQSCQLVSQAETGEKRKVKNDSL